VFISTLIALAGTDLEHQFLPNVIAGPAALVGLDLSVLGNPEWRWVYLVSAVVVAGTLFALADTRPHGTGIGEVKMGGMLVAFLGPYAALSVFLGALSGAVTGGLLMAAGRMRRRSPMPFGVFLAFGSIVALFFGP
jgi:leader peptidase (prepilin peptidase)/N-methyltransferase